MGDIQGRAFSQKLERDKTLWKSIPHPKFPTISITGSECELNCDHCGGHYLEGMISVKGPNDLQETCLELFSEGAEGVLLSGGYNSEGYVPFEPFLDAIEQIKIETGLFISVHSGLVPDELSEELGSVGVDSVNFDLIADDSTISSKLGLSKKVEDYGSSLRSVSRDIPNISPHILLGLSGKNLEQEKKGISFLEGFDMSALVFLIIIPPSNSNYTYSILEPDRIGHFIAEARLKFPDTPISLGCMRPRSKERASIEIESIKSGIDRIVLPSRKAVDFAENKGLVVRELEACCSVPENFIEERI